MDKKLKTLAPLAASENTDAASTLMELSEEDLGSVTGGSDCTMWVPGWGIGIHVGYPRDH